MIESCVNGCICMHGTIFLPTAEEDFIPLETSLVFDEGLDSTRCVYIPILNDECLEYEEEYFNITLSSEQDCVRFLNDSIEATIIDNDCEYHGMFYCPTLS